MCTRIALSNGNFAIVCGRGSHGKGSGKRYFCADCLAEGKKVEAPFLCDGPGKEKGTTCDRGMCDKHVARRTRKNDYCSRCAPERQVEIPIAAEAP